ncbi:hypothetical protein N658DRAFT_202266 [Parathielavia hyrcaniae]|uniref:Uncharacterized protein n=1 Tax=Parathielavia hyrcaniae TaxID=113614 RepID=A0AAN6PXK7_9PEZI|nr:hypothetical protein N658DRAFT_202266 [Parathielavia hyrcaniae]
MLLSVCRQLLTRANCRSLKMVPTEKDPRASPRQAGAVRQTAGLASLRARAVSERISSIPSMLIRQPPLRVRTAASPSACTYQLPAKWRKLSITVKQPSTGNSVGSLFGSPPGTAGTRSRKAGVKTGLRILGRVNASLHRRTDMEWNGMFRNYPRRLAQLALTIPPEDADALNASESTKHNAMPARNATSQHEESR